MSNLKIAICVYCLSKGGAERVASLWANGFSQRGHHVSMLLFDDKMPITYKISKDIPITYLTCKGSNKYLNHVKMTFLLREKLKKIKPDVVIAVQQPYGIWSWLATRGLNIPIIFTDHNAFEWPKDTKDIRKTRYIEKFYINRLFDCVTVLTEVDRQLLLPKQKNTITLPNPLTFHVRDAVPEKQNIILAAGRLDVWYTKGFDILIKAWAKIADKYPNWVLQIIGSGNIDSTNYLNTLCLEYGIKERVDFCGFQDNIVDYYSNASIFVLSSRFEGFGMVLTEAMSQGCATIACDWNGRQKEIITSTDIGLLCPVNDTNELAQKIEYMIVNKDYRLKAQKNALTRASYYSLPNIIDQWECIFKKINIL